MTIFLLHVTPYDSVSAAEVDVRFSYNAPFPSFDGEHWPARLLAPPEFTVVAFQTEAFGDGRPTRVGIGPLQIGISERDDATLLNYDWNGRSFTLYKAPDGTTSFASFTSILQGVVEDVDWTRTTFTLNVADFSTELDRPFAAGYFASGDAITPDAAAVSKPKPRALGKPKNVTPTLISAANHIYQCGSGNVFDIANAYDGGGVLNNAGALSPIDDPVIAADALFKGVSAPTQTLSLQWGEGGDSLYILSINSLGFGGGGTTTYSIYRYPAGEPYEVSTLFPSVSRASFSVSSSFLVRDFVISPNGLNLYVLTQTSSGGGGGVEGYTLSKAWDITTLSANGSFVLSSVTYGDVETLEINNTGTVVLVGSGSLGANDGRIFELDLSTAYDITTASAGGTFDSGAEWGFEGSMRFADDGARLITYSVGTRKLRLYNLSTDYDITTAAFDTGEEVVMPSGRNAYAATWNGGGSSFSLLNRSDANGLQGVESFSTVTSYTISDGAILGFNDYVVDETDGLLRLARTPQFGLTVDVEGEEELTLLVTGVISQAERVLEGVLPSSAIDTASFTALKTTTGDPDVSLYVGSDERPTYGDIITRLLSSVGCVLLPGSDGTLRGVQLTVGTPVATITENDVVQGSFRRVEPPRPIHRVRLRYDRAWTLQTGAELDVSRVEDSYQQFVSAETRIVSSESAAVFSRFLRARQGTFDTLLDTETDAEAEADRRLALSGARRDEYRIALLGVQYQYQAGDTVTLVHSASRTPAGLDMLIRTVQEKADGTTLLSLWG